MLNPVLVAMEINMFLTGNNTKAPMNRKVDNPHWITIDACFKFMVDINMKGI